MTRWQDGPLTMSNYYACALDNWCFFETYGKPRKTCYSMVAYGELLKTAPNRVETVDGGGRVALLGGIGDDGAKRLLVSAFETTVDYSNGVLTLNPGKSGVCLIRF